MDVCPIFMGVIGVSDDGRYHENGLMPVVVGKVSHDKVSNLWQCAEFIECFHLLSFVMGLQLRQMSSTPRHPLFVGSVMCSVFTSLLDSENRIIKIISLGSLMK